MSRQPTKSGIHWLRIAVAGVALSLAGCATTPSPSSNESINAVEDADPVTQTSASGPSLTAEMPESTPSVFIGNDTNILMPPPKSAVSLDGDAVMVNFEQAPLAEVVHSILGETLGLDYVIEHPIKARSRCAPVRQSLEISYCPYWSRCYATITC